MHGRTVWSMQRCVWWDAVGDLQVQNGTARICREVRARRRAQKIAAGCWLFVAVNRGRWMSYVYACLVQKTKDVFLAWFLDEDDSYGRALSMAIRSAGTILSLCAPLDRQR